MWPFYHDFVLDQTNISNIIILKKRICREKLSLNATSLPTNPPLSQTENRYQTQEIFKFQYDEN